MAHPKTTRTRTAAQTRSAASPSSKDKRRVWTAWNNLPCAWCGLPMYVGTDKVGRLLPDKSNACDASIGHVVPFATCLTYNAPMVAPSCNTCQVATGDRDVSDVVAPAPDWRQVAQTTADAHYASRTITPRESLPGHDARNTARKARLGW